VDANHVFEQLIGYSLYELQHKRYSVFLSPEQEKSDDHILLWQKLCRGEYHTGQYRWLRKDGTEIWIVAHFYPIKQEAKETPTSIIQFASNITEQKLAEIQLKLAVKEAVAVANINDRSARIPMEGKTGEIEKLCSSVNSLLSKVDEQTKILMAEKENAERATK